MLIRFFCPKLNNAETADVEELNQFGAAIQ